MADTVTYTSEKGRIFIDYRDFDILFKTIIQTKDGLEIETKMRVSELIKKLKEMDIPDEEIDLNSYRITRFNSK